MKQTNYIVTATLKNKRTPIAHEPITIFALSDVLAGIAEPDKIESKPVKINGVDVPVERYTYNDDKLQMLQTGLDEQVLKSARNRVSVTKLPDESGATHTLSRAFAATVDELTEESTGTAYFAQAANAKTEFTGFLTAQGKTPEQIARILGYFKDESTLEKADTSAKEKIRPYWLAFVDKALPAEDVTDEAGNVQHYGKASIQAWLNKMDPHLREIKAPDLDF